MEKKLELFKYVFILCIVVSFLTQLVYIVSFELTLSLIQKVVLVMIQILSIVGYVHFDIMNKSIEVKRKEILRVHWILFVIYCFNLLYILFFDPDFGRRVFEGGLSFQDYLDYNVNLDIFETIQLFMNGYKNGVVSMETLLRNLLGNMVIFIPMAYFLPVLFKKQRKFIWFFITIFLMVLSVEVIQVYFRIGSGDIDDLFLNVSGCIIMYGILKCLLIKKL